MAQWMKEPYRKSVANYPDPESYMNGRAAGHEALTGVHSDTFVVSSAGEA